MSLDPGVLFNYLRKLSDLQCIFLQLLTMGSMKTLVISLFALFAFASAKTLTIVNNCDKDFEYSYTYFPSLSTLNCGPVDTIVSGGDKRTFDYGDTGSLIIKDFPLQDTANFRFIITLDDSRYDIGFEEGSCESLDGGYGMFEPKSFYIELCGPSPIPESPPSPIPESPPSPILESPPSPILESPPSPIPESPPSPNPESPPSPNPESPPSPNPPPSDESSSIPLGAIIGASVGGVVLIVGVIVACVCIKKRKKNRQDPVLDTVSHDTFVVPVVSSYTSHPAPARPVVDQVISGNDHQIVNIV